MFNQSCSTCYVDQTREPDANYDSLQLLSECRFPTMGRGRGRRLQKKCRHQGQRSSSFKKRSQVAEEGAPRTFPFRERTKRYNPHREEVWRRLEEPRNLASLFMTSFESLFCGAASPLLIPIFLVLAELGNHKLRVVRFVSLYNCICRRG